MPIDETLAKEQALLSELGEVLDTFLEDTPMTTMQVIGILEALKNDVIHTSMSMDDDEDQPDWLKN